MFWWLHRAALSALVLSAPACAPSPSPMLEALAAPGPHPAHRQRLATFGQFVGAWNMDIRFFDAQGAAVFHGPGRWVFGWVLDGRAIQDVLTYAPLDASGHTALGERRIGTTLRHYDAKQDEWRVVLLGASSGALVVLTGRPSGDHIELLGSEAPGIVNRWSFRDVSADAFRWVGEISEDGGATFRVEQEMFARRER